MTFDHEEQLPKRKKPLSKCEKGKGFSRVSVFEVLEGHVLYVPDKVLMTWVNGELLEDLDQDQTENELDGEVTFFGEEL